MPATTTPTSELPARPLSADAWDVFAALVDRHNGVWGSTTRKECEAGLVRPPDWRVTCFFVGRDRLRRGVAPPGALDQIAEAGGGVVEG
jgi:hypothetical protein